MRSVAGRKRGWRHAGIALAYAGLLLGVAALAAADTVWIRSGESGTGLPREDVTIIGVEDGELIFQTKQGRETRKALEQVSQIKIDADPAFSKAEEAFSKQQWKEAAKGYIQAAKSSNVDWVKDRANQRLTVAAAKGGDFPAAVNAYLYMLGRDPNLAAKNRPAIPEGQAGKLNAAVTAVDAARKNTRLSADARARLQTFYVDLLIANGQSDVASRELDQAPTPTRDGDGGKARGNADASANPLQARQKLQAAQVALEQKDYQKAIDAINSASEIFTEPALQAQALYMLADAQAGLAEAGGDADGKAAALRDAALAYMRVVAHFRENPQQRERVARALIRAATLLEATNEENGLAESLKLFEQASEEFEGTDYAAQAKTGADRVRGKVGQQEQAKR